MSLVQVEKKERFAIVTLNRPEKHNALLPEMLVRLADIWDDLASDDAIRAVVLTGAGNGAFCSGGDLGRLIPLYTGNRAPDDEWDARLVTDPTIWDRGMLRGVGFPKPVIAAVNGPAFAGGAELLLASDIRILAETATVAFPEVRRGMVAGGGALARICRQIGWASAMEMMLMGEPVSAERALALGLVNKVTPRDQLLETALDYAARIARGAPVALAQAKQIMVLSNGLSLEEAFFIERERTQIVARSSDAEEGPRAFMERREPCFVGR